MKTFIVSGLVLLNVILESTLFQYLRIMNIKPDFVIILIVAYAILEGSKYSALIGLASGLVLDIMFGKVLGVNAFSYMITGYLMGQAHENVFKDSIFPPAIFNLIAVIVCQHIYFLLMYMTGNLLYEGVSYMYILVRVIIPQGLYNAVLGAVIYRFYLHLDEKNIMQKRVY